MLGGGLMVGGITGGVTGGVTGGWALLPLEMIRVTVEPAGAPSSWRGVVQATVPAGASESTRSPWDMTTLKPIDSSLAPASAGVIPFRYGRSFTLPRMILSSGLVNLVVGIPCRAPCIAVSQIGPAVPEPDASLSFLPLKTCLIRFSAGGSASPTTAAAASLDE